MTKKPRRFAEKTSVPIGRSQDELRRGFERFSICTIRWAEASDLFGGDGGDE